MRPPLTDVTCLIPLYASQRLLDNIYRNIDEHVQLGATVICSDQHGLDDAIAQIQQRYSNQLLVRSISSEDGGNWVSNINLLIEAANTDYFRIIPHDDSVHGEATVLLAEALRSNSSAILCHGYVRAEDMEGNRMEDRDGPNFPLVPLDGPDMFSMGLFWQGLYNGAFKALIRRKMTPEGPVLIRPTLDLVHAERAWLYALSLLGEFMFEERASMVKRYWTGSLTDAWKPGAAHLMSVATTMASYVDLFVKDSRRGTRLKFNIGLNMLQQTNWYEGFEVTKPCFYGLVPVIK